MAVVNAPTRRNAGHKGPDPRQAARLYRQPSRPARANANTLPLWPRAVVQAGVASRGSVLS